MYEPNARRSSSAPTPQSHPELFTTEELTAEIKYLMALNRKHGSNEHRTMAYLKLAKIRASRPDWNPS